MHGNVATGDLFADVSDALDAESSKAFRKLYARAADPEAALPDGDWIELVRTELVGASADVEQPLETLIAEAAIWSSTAAKRFRAAANATDADSRRLMIRKAVLGWAPLGLAAGAWLQWLSSPGTADAALFLRILALYASDVGVGQPSGSRGSAYLALLRQLRTSENAAPLARLGGDPRICDDSFRLPALLLLMSRRPSDFSAELIGGDLCIRAVGLAPPLALARPELRADWGAIDPSETRDGTVSPAAQSRTAAEALIHAGPKYAARVYAGFGWTLAGLRTQTAALYDEMTASLNPWHDMADLMKRRAREGSVYHRRVLIDDRPLAAWLEDCRKDPLPFLEVLSRSKLVVPGRSDASHLVRGLISARGPMFRVFSQDDLTIIRRWIDALPTESCPGQESTGGKAADAVRARPPRQDLLAALPILLETRPQSGEGPGDLRQAYHMLMGRNRTPALDDWSLRYIRGWLARARHRIGSGAVALPGVWKSGGLRLWLQTQHDRHGADFEETAAAPLPPREAVVEDIVQTAPLTLIDGSWLSGFTDYELASSNIGHSLFTTYWDELGNGEVDLNHPLIYRELLKEMGFDLPPTASPGFANWSGFRNESFRLPVFWLCIGRFPRTFLPETLGLNLAMELSGVGGSYRRSSMALRAYGFSTRFVDIHNTIDNVATGHSAWAADAVDALMAGLPDSGGPGSRAEVWERVRIGYGSLNPPRGVMASWLFVRARFAGRWWPHSSATPMVKELAGV